MAGRALPLAVSAQHCRNGASGCGAPRSAPHLQRLDVPRAIVLGALLGLHLLLEVAQALEQHLLIQQRALPLRLAVLQRLLQPGDLRRRGRGRPHVRHVPMEGTAWGPTPHQPGPYLVLQPPHVELHLFHLGAPVLGLFLGVRDLLPRLLLELLQLRLQRGQRAVRLLRHLLQLRQSGDSSGAGDRPAHPVPSGWDTRREKMPVGMGLGGEFLPHGLGSLTARGASPARAAWVTPDPEPAPGSCRSCLGKGRGQHGPGTPGDADPGDSVVLRSFMEGSVPTGSAGKPRLCPKSRIPPAAREERSPSRGTAAGCGCPMGWGSWGRKHPQRHPGAPTSLFSFSVVRSSRRFCSSSSLLARRSCSFCRCSSW